jgi:hypothetical protein
MMKNGAGMMKTATRRPRSNWLPALPLIQIFTTGDKTLEIFLSWPTKQLLCQMAALYFLADQPLLDLRPALPRRPLLTRQLIQYSLQLLQAHQYRAWDFLGVAPRKDWLYLQRVAVQVMASSPKLQSQEVQHRELQLQIVQMSRFQHQHFCRIRSVGHPR